MSEVAADASAPASDDRAPAASDFQGLVDNATSDRLYGWVHDISRPGERLRVELRLGGETVATAIADIPRPDLAKNGVGDGCHAFEFTLTPEMLERRRELALAAFNSTGAEFPIAVRLRLPKQEADNRDRIMVAEQRRLRTTVEALVERMQQMPEAELMQQAALRQIELAERLQALEIWLARLDRHLGERPAAPPPPPRVVDAWQMMLFGVLGIALLSAFAVAYFLRAG